MNTQEYDILNALERYSFANQRKLAEQSGYSLGKVNLALKVLQKNDYINADMKLTKKARAEIKHNKPKNAIILAAGSGLRMIPINTEHPKALLELHGEIFIERIIKQLHEVGVTDITIVVGFMKEQFDYLIDEYGVKLVFAQNYMLTNNLHSLQKVSSKLGNTYLVPCDLWCLENPFSEKEYYSWYMLGDTLDKDSTYKVNRKQEIVATKNLEEGNLLIGIAYILEDDAKTIRNLLDTLVKDPAHNQDFWEDPLMKSGKLLLHAKVVNSNSVCEINTMEELRALDEDSGQLNVEALKVVMEVFNCELDDIKDITMLKMGISNRSFKFSCKDEQYIMRIPGRDASTNREEEYAAYQVVAPTHLCDPLVYIHPTNGLKISKFIENARNPDPQNMEDVRRCIACLRKLHDKRLQVDHVFNIYEMLETYETLWNGAQPAYKDYAQTKAKILELKEFIDEQPKVWGLTHIDPHLDNFILTDNEIYLVDWEYAAMQDVHLDIVSLPFVGNYDKDMVDKLIDIYFEDKCEPAVRAKIYCYMSTLALVWTAWCESVRLRGIEVGEYALIQYRYAKDYYKYAKEGIELARKADN